LLAQVNIGLAPNVDIVFAVREFLGLDQRLSLDNDILVATALFHMLDRAFLVTDLGDTVDLDLFGACINGANTNLWFRSHINGVFAIVVALEVCFFRVLDRT
jgi:hypothetical protein